MRVYALLLMTILFLHVSAQDDKRVSDATVWLYNIKGKVISVTEHRDCINDSICKQNKHYIKDIEIKFDTNGMISKKRSYWADDSPFEIMDATYDGQGKRTTLITRGTKQYAVGEPPPVNDTRHNHKMIKRKSIDSTWSIYPYPRQAQWSINSYSDDGTSKGFSTFYSDSSLCSKAIYIRDKKGKRIETDIVDSEGKIFCKSVYSTDNFGQSLITRYRKNHGKLYKYMVTIKDTAGRESVTSFFKPDGSINLKCSYKYDSRGNQIKYECTDVNGENGYGTDTFYSNFDNKGNWIQAIESQNGIEEYIVKRTIEYY